jgi:hypothetical protein
VATAGLARVRTPVGGEKEVESYDIELRPVYRPGTVDGLLAFLRGNDIAARSGFLFDLEPITVRLARGHYSLTASVLGAELDGRFYTAVIVQPVLAVDRARTVLLDANAAQPVVVTVPRASARRVIESVDFTRWLPDHPDGATLFASSSTVPDPDGDERHIYYTDHLGPNIAEDDLVVTLQSTWAEPGPTEDRFANSPYIFNVALVPPGGRFPTGFTRPLRPEDLATVKNEVAEHVPGLVGVLTAVGFPDRSFLASGAELPVQLPASRTDYYTAADINWFLGFNEQEADEFTLETSMNELAPIVFEPGHARRASWNKAVLGPNVNFVEPILPPVFRADNDIDIVVPLLADDPARFGFSPNETGQTRLFRDDVLLGEIGAPGFGRFEVPPEPSVYRIEIDYARGGLSQLSTEVQLTWTFRSGQTDEGELEALPVFTIFFRPALDDRNTAPAGGIHAVPLSLVRQPGALAAPLRTLTVEASHDRGQTWRPALVLRLGDRAVALVRHPQGDGMVSLRARAADEAGNTASQTILDAYRVRRR